MALHHSIINVVAATDLVIPKTAALDAVYINLFGIPFVDDETDAILIIDPPPFLSFWVKSL